jgi:phytoene desaturase
MRTVTAERSVVIVGAGRAARFALFLAGRPRGNAIERESVPGGRAGRLSVDGYEFDTGRPYHDAGASRPLAAVGEISTT